MNKAKGIELINLSFKRCMEKEGFITQFYYELCNIHPAAYCHLSGPDLEKYKANLQSTLVALVDFGKGLSKGKKELGKLAGKETGLTEDIALYWEEALMISIGANDEELDQETSTAWRSLIKLGQNFILSKRNKKLAA